MPIVWIKFITKWL